MTEHDRTPIIEVTDTRKPAQQVASIEAVLTAQDATYDELVIHGLAALGETKERLYDYGVRGHARPSDPAFTFSGTFTVFGCRS